MMMGRTYIAIALSFQLLAQVLVAATDYGAMLARSEAQSSVTKKQAKILQQLRGLIEDPAATDDQKARSFEVILAIHARHKAYDKMLSTAEQMRKALPGHRGAQRDALLTQVDTLNALRKRAEAIDKARAFLDGFEDDPSAVRVRLRLAEHLYAERNYTACVNETQKVLGTIRDDDAMMSSALALQVLGAARSGDMKLEVATLETLVEDKYLAFQGKPVDHLSRYVGGLRKMKRHRDALAVCLQLEKDRTHTADERRAWCRTGADCLYDLQTYDEAVAQYERVLIDYPLNSEGWSDIQSRIVASLTRAGKSEDALRASKISLDAVSEPGRFPGVFRVISGLFDQVDGNEDRARQFMAFQACGSAGPDGKTGTPDDVVDPLRAIRYPDCSVRETAFAKAVRECGDGAAASTHRGMCAVLSGHAADGLPYFVQAFRQARMGEMYDSGRNMVAVGIRAVRGHAVGLEKDFAFVAYGPNGRDGEKGTADDLEDSLKQIIDAAEASLGAKKITLSEDDVAVLEEARGFLDAFAASAIQPGAFNDRKMALAALERIHGALNDWSNPDVRTWYAHRLNDVDLETVLGPVLEGAIAAAKAGEYHLGGVRELWQEIQPTLEEFAEANKGRTVSRFRGEWLKMDASFGKAASYAPASPKKR